VHAFDYGAGFLGLGIPVNNATFFLTIHGWSVILRVRSIRTMVAGAIGFV